MRRHRVAKVPPSSTKGNNSILVRSRQQDVTEKVEAMSTALKTYQNKRDFKKTSEPSGAENVKASKKQLLFCVQKHAASHLHYDFRLEAQGVLVSWAVPKGPSLDPGQKRLAVHVEDHPIGYASFEGSIPQGEYGGGDVIVWDIGTFRVEGLPATATKDEMGKAVLRGIAKGKLTIIMHGKKLNGAFTLIQLSRPGAEKNWLLVKGDDEFAKTGSDQEITDDIRSVLSKKTLKDPEAASPAKSTKAKSTRAKSTPTKAAVAKSTISKKTVSAAAAKPPKLIEPMLASLASQPFSTTNWIYEPKFDGIRAIAYIFKGQVKMLSRNGIDITDKFPQIVDQLTKLTTNMIIDGEIVAINDKGVPSFELLQARSMFKSKGKTASGPLIRFYVFDILQADTASLLNEPLSARLPLLKKHVSRKSNKNVLVVEAYTGDGKKAFQKAMEEGMEGIVAKSLDSVYTPGKRSANWLKVKGNKSSEFVVCGFSAGGGARNGLLGALIIAERNKDGSLQYAGKVGTGFNTRLLKELTKQLKTIKVAKSPVTVPKEYASKDVTWVKPELVAEIKYSEKTKQGLLRAPVFMHLRADIDPVKIVPEAVVVVDEKKTVKSEKKTIKVATKKTGAKALSKSPAKRTKSANSSPEIAELIERLDSAPENGLFKVEDYEVKLSHLNKIFWPASESTDAVTKRDYIRYLLQASPYILQHLKDRPFTMIRMPDGINGQRFFQKHQKNTVPPFLETVDYYSEHSDGDGEFLLCNNLATLVWCGQMGGLELHASHTRIAPEKNLPGKTTGSLKNVENSVANHPDYLVLDLDPYIYSGKEKHKEEPQLHQKGFDKTCESALWLKEILDGLKLEAFVKTSGKTGLHIYIPIERNIPYDAVRSCCEILGRHLLAAHPEDITMEWSIKKRPGKIFFDHNMNARGKTLPVPYSLRSAVEASASTPLDWKELGHVYPTDFTVFTMPERLATKGDIWAGILQHRNDLKKKLNL